MVNVSLKEKLVAEMAQELEKRQYNYTIKALHQIVDEWEQRKGKLIELFRKHPNWNEESLMIQFDVDYERAKNIDTIRDFCNTMQKRLANIYSHTWGEKQNELSRLYEVIGCLGGITCTVLSEDTIEQLMSCRFFKRDENQKFVPKNGQRVTRLMNRLLGTVPEIIKESDYNKLFAQYADAVTPLKIKRHTLLSLNPLDFLLQSHGNSWNSCHYIGNHRDEYGCHSSGTIGYMLDETSFVFYTVDASYNGNEIELEPKISRCMFAYEEYELIQQRVYPQNTDGDSSVYEAYRNIVQEAIAICTDKPNYWKTNHEAYRHAYRGEGSTIYPDWEEQNRSCSAYSYLVEMQEYVENRNEEMEIGAKPMCVCSGKRHRSSRINPYAVCSVCGKVEPIEDMNWIDGNTVCDECSFYCNGHQRYELISNTTIHEQRVGYGADRYCDEYWYSNFTLCDDCGAWYENGKGKTDEESLCQKCKNRRELEKIKNMQGVATATSSGTSRIFFKKFWV